MVTTSKNQVEVEEGRQLPPRIHREDKMSTHITTNLSDIASLIHESIARRDDATLSWAEATLDLCVSLAQARTKFPSNLEFGAWCEQCQFKLNHQDRAAAVALGKHADAWKILQSTNSRSLQLIHAEEFRVTSASNTEKPEEKQQVSKRSTATKKRDEPEVEKAKGFFDDLKAEGKEPTIANIIKESEARGQRVGKSAASTAKAIRETEESIREEAKIEARKEIEDEEYFVRVYIEKLDEILKVLRFPQNNVMTRSEYKRLLIALHPDTWQLRTFDQVNEAFLILQKYEAKMVSDEPERKLSAAFPRTKEEMMARRNHA